MSTSLAASSTARPPPSFPSRSPLRKPVPTSQQTKSQQPAARPQSLSQDNVAFTRAQPQPQPQPQSQPPRSPQQSSAPSHPRSRLSSSGPAVSYQSQSSQRQSYPSPPSSTGNRASSSPDRTAMNYQQQQQHLYGNSQYPPMARRTLSNATTSTSSTSGGRKTSFAGTTLTRSTSSRSGGGPSSYVALMRKQKATVWSDRAQHEDPRLVAQQRAAKMRAAMEVSGANYHTSATSTMTGGVRSKIRTHGVQKAQQYTPIAHPASGVPMRLSAREVEDDDGDDDEHLAVRGGTSGAHQRSGSGRSSAGSTGRLSSMYGPAGAGRSSSGGNTPPNVRSSSSSNNSHSHAATATPATPEQRPRADTQSTLRSEEPAEPTPVPGKFRGSDYFGGARVADDEAEENEEAGFGKASGLPRRVNNLALEDKSAADDLQRRGSVDERTTTMRGYGRLFVANPDLSD